MNVELQQVMNWNFCFITWKCWQWMVL